MGNNGTAARRVTALSSRRSGARPESAGAARTPIAAAARVLVVVLIALATRAAVSTAAPAPAAAGKSSPTGTAQPAVPPRPAAEGPAPESIPVPEVARRADEAGRVLRDIDALLVPDSFIEGIDKRFPTIAARIASQTAETDRQLAAEPTGAMLDALASQWQAARAEMAGYVNALGQRATVLEGALSRLATMQETWTRARADAQASRAPAPVIGRISGVLTAVSGVRTRAQEARAATLVSQDRFAQQVAQCESALERIARARQEGRLLEPDSAPLWRAEEIARMVNELPDQVRGAAAADIALLRRFAQEQRWKIPIHVALFLGLALLIRAAGRRLRASAEPGQPAVRAFGRPLSAALVLALLASPWIYSPPLPRAFVALTEMLALVPAVRIMRLLVERSLVPGLYVLTGFFLTDLVRHFASVAPLLERQIFLLEMLAGAIVLSWWVVSRRPRPPASPASPFMDRQRALWAAACVVLAAFTAAFVAGAAGYMGLASLLGGRIFGNGYLALVLYAGVRVGDGLVSFVLRARPFCYLGMVRRRRSLLEQRAHGLLRSLAIGAWAILSLKYFGLWPATVSTVTAVLGAELRLGSVGISLGGVLLFALTVAGAFVLSAVIRFALEEDVYPHLNLGRGLPYALSSLLHYFLLLVGFLLALAALGVDLTKITIVAGALGVGIGFGLQNLVNNFVSGSLILFERKIQVGDAVQIGDVSGQVQQLGMRACTVRTWEGAEVIVPNASLTADKVTNWTLSDRRRRIDVAVGVAHGTPPGKVLDVLLGVARSHPLVLADPEPMAQFQAFGDSALLFALYAWTDRFDLWAKIRSELNVALYEALREAGIEIPFPQRDVHVRHE